MIVPLCMGAQPFTKKYIMSFHICDATCYQVNDHMTNLAESDDGTNWTLVPNFSPHNGSVPDVIIRGNKLYLYNPGKVKRYDNSTGLWDAGTTQVTVTDSAGWLVQYVDPSAYIDSLGRIVLFFLNSTGNPMGQDPAGCQTYPCIKYFDSATEVDGSDGTQFVKDPGHRLVYNLTSGTASDPDIFYDGSKYIMYISKGGSVYAYNSNTLNGTYTAIPGLTNGLLTFQGGVPCGYYDPVSGNYWTYVHSNVSGSVIIKQAIHANFSSQLNTFTTVMSGPIIGEPSTSKTESPGFCVNEFLTNSGEISFSGINIYPVPATGELFIEKKNEQPINKLEIYNMLAERIYSVTDLNQQEKFVIDISGFIKGIYFVKIYEAERVATVKIVIQ